MCFYPEILIVLNVPDIVEEHSLCPVINQSFKTGYTLGKGGTEEVVMKTTFSYIVVCYASGHAWQ